MIVALLWLAAALSALGLLVMLGSSVCMTGVGQVWPSRLFDVGAAIFCLSLVVWLIVAVAGFFATASGHAA